MLRRVMLVMGASFAFGLDAWAASAGSQGAGAGRAGAPRAPARTAPVPRLPASLAGPQAAPGLGAAIPGLAPAALPSLPASAVPAIQRLEAIQAHGQVADSPAWAHPALPSPGTGAEFSRPAFRAAAERLDGGARQLAEPMAELESLPEGEGHERAWELGRRMWNETSGLGQPSPAPAETGALSGPLPARARGAAETLAGLPLAAAPTLDAAAGREPRSVNSVRQDLEASPSRGARFVYSVRKGPEVRVGMPEGVPLLVLRVLPGGVSFAELSVAPGVRRAAEAAAVGAAARLNSASHAPAFGSRGGGEAAAAEEPILAGAGDALAFSAAWGWSEPAAAQLASGGAAAVRAAEAPEAAERAAGERRAAAAGSFAGADGWLALLGIGLLLAGWRGLD